MEAQLDLFAEPKTGVRFFYREGDEYAWPEPQNYDERCIDGVLMSTQNQWVLKQLLAGKSWSEAAGNSHVGRWGDLIRYQADPKGLEVFEGEIVRRIKPSVIIERAHLYRPVTE